MSKPLDIFAAILGGNGGAAATPGLGMLGDVPAPALLWLLAPFSMAKSFSQPKIPRRKQLFSQLFIPSSSLQVYSCAEV